MHNTNGCNIEVRILSLTRNNKSRKYNILKETLSSFLEGVITELKPNSFCFQVESADLIAYGLIPEFIGRFPILVSLSALTEDQLVQVTSLMCLCLSLFVLF